MVMIRRLIWETKNIRHIAKHKITPEEVEQACHSKHVALQAKYGRIMLIGTTSANQIITAVLDPELQADVYYVVTAYPANKKQCDYYRLHKGGTL